LPKNIYIYKIVKIRHAEGGGGESEGGEGGGGGGCFRGLTA